MAFCDEKDAHLKVGAAKTARDLTRPRMRRFTSARRLA